MSFSENGQTGERRGAEVTERLLLALALLAVGGWMGWSLYSEHARIEAAERDHLANQALIIDLNMGRQLGAVNNALISLQSDLPEWRDEKDGQAQLSRRLQSLSGAMPGVRTLFVVNGDGMVTASNRAGLIGQDLHERDYFKVARESNNPAILHVSPPIKNVLGTYAINLERSITDRDGRFDGLVAATLDPEYFSTLLSSVIYAPDMWASLVHADGTLFLVVPGMDLPLGTNLARPGSLFSRHMESGEITTVMVGRVLASNELRMAARRTVRPAEVPMDAPLVVAVTRDMTALFAPWRQDAATRTGGFGLLVLVAAGALQFFQSRQRALARLTAQRERERIRDQTILKTASDGIHIVDTNGLLLEANDAFLRMLGYDETIIGRLRVADWDAADPWEDIKPTIGALIDGHGTRVFQTSHRRRDGSIIEVEINASGIEIDGKGYLYAASRDITERKVAERALRSSENRFRRLVEQSPLAMGLVGVDGEIGYINRKFTETFGYLPEDIPNLERWCAQAYPDEAYRAEVIGLWTGLIETARDSGAEIEADEYRIVCKSGDVKTVSI